MIAEWGVEVRHIDFRHDEIEIRIIFKILKLFNNNRNITNLLHFGLEIFRLPCTELKNAL